MPPRSSQPADHAAATLRILMVEDDKSNALVTGTILSLLGYEYTVVENGQDALRALENQHYGLILMDIVLHGTLSGVEVARQIRRREHEHRTQPVPILALTAQSHIEGEHACRQAGIDDFLCKPFHMDDLQEKIHAIRS